MAGDPQRNLNFYHGLLAQRLVKITVNFDDPATYHFYFADKVGSPGTVMTHFPWPRARRGTVGNGETGAVAYSISPESLPFWRERLASHGISLAASQVRFGDEVLSFHDPDGIAVELITVESPPSIQTWDAANVPIEHALRGFHSVTLWLDDVDRTAALLIDHMGFAVAGQDNDRTRLVSTPHAPGHFIDLLARPGKGRGDFGVGSVHHIAFRAADDDQQLEYREALLAARFNVTEVKDRQYFHSIYFRSPGGVLFEIATDVPGFLVDETVESLGNGLRLPPWLEPRRSEIEASLQPVVHPDQAES
jgi:glyoxalase family protein